MRSEKLEVRKKELNSEILAEGINFSIGHPELPTHNFHST